VFNPEVIFQLVKVGKPNFTEVALLSGLALDFVLVPQSGAQQKLSAAVAKLCLQVDVLFGHRLPAVDANLLLLVHVSKVNLHRLFRLEPFAFAQFALDSSPAVNFGPVRLQKESRSGFERARGANERFQAFIRRVGFLEVLPAVVPTFEEPRTPEHFALEGFFSVLRLDVNRQIVRFIETPRAENAAHLFLEFADDVRLQDVFVPLVRGEEVSGTVLVEVALDAFLLVVFFHVELHPLHQFAAVNALGGAFRLVLFLHVLLLVPLRQEEFRTPSVHLALDHLVLVLRPHVRQERRRRAKVFAAVNALEFFSVHAFCVSFFLPDS